MPRGQRRSVARVPKPLAPDAPKGLGAALQGKNDETPVEVDLLPEERLQPAQAAVEHAEAAISEAEEKVQDLNLVDVNSKLKVGDFVGKGNRQISNSHGEFVINPDTGKVTKCL